MTNISQNTSRNKLNRQQLELINRRTIGYPLQIAEKDYFLALAYNITTTNGGIDLSQISEQFNLNRSSHCISSCHTGSCAF